MNNRAENSHLPTRNAMLVGPPGTTARSAAAPTPSWGKMIAQDQSFLLLAPWITLIPDACISLATLGFNLLGHGPRDYFDPIHIR
jgi:hypothetical protein